jgi:hypothetical protein
LLGEKLEINVYRIDEDTYSCSIFDGKCGVYNNYGSTPEKAKEMALWKLKRCYGEENNPLE